MTMVVESTTTSTPTKEKKPRKEKKSKETTADAIPNDKETIIEKPKKKKRKHAEKPAEEVEVETIEVDNIESTLVDTDKKLSKKEKKKAKKQETVEMEVDEVETGKSAVVETEKKLSKSEKKAEEQAPEQVKEPKVSAEEPKGGEEKKRKKRKKGTVAADPEEETVEDGPPKKKRKNKTGLADPDDDKTLTNQARKALLYAFEQFRRPDKWKFQKARQNWLVRNIWSAEAIPEAYEPLLIKYLSETKGGVRENLIKSCQTILESSPVAPEPVPAPKQVDPPKEAEMPATGGALVVPVVEKVPDPIKLARAKLILQALESFVDPET